MIVPIIIYRDRRSDKDIREDMARERRWAELMEKEDAAERKRKQEEKEKKLREKAEDEKRRNDAYEALRHKDEWQTQFMPEGWSIFGQTNFSILTEYSQDETNQNS